MNRPAVVSLVMKLICGCYGYMFMLGSANVAACELRKPGACGPAWSQAFTLAGGAASTLWAYVVDSPNSPTASRRRNGPPPS